MSLSLTYPTPLPSTKGWGAGWHTGVGTCDVQLHGHLKPHLIFQGGVHEDIAELTDLLVTELESRGYQFHPGWSWGYGCRATKGGNGDTPSFHSWGLALDFNAPENVFGGSASSSDLNTNNHWVPPLMAEYGFFWLGPSIKDWMHFSFAGTPVDAKTMTEKARLQLGGGDEVAFADFKDGVRAAKNGLKDPGKNLDFSFGYNMEQRATSLPKPVKGDKGDPGPAPAAHKHAVPGTSTGPGV